MFTYPAMRNSALPLAIIAYLIFLAVGSCQSTCTSTSTDACARQDALYDPSRVSLLQVGHAEHVNRALPVHQSAPNVLNVQKINAAASTAERLELLKPISWLDIEKCGSTMQVVLGSFTELWEGCTWE